MIDISDMATVIDFVNTTVDNTTLDNESLPIKTGETYEANFIDFTGMAMTI